MEVNVGEKTCRRALNTKVEKEYLSHRGKEEKMGELEGTEGGKGNAAVKIKAKRNALLINEKIIK